MRTLGQQAVADAVKENSRAFVRYLPGVVFLGNGSGVFAVPGGQSQRLVYYYTLASGGGQRPANIAPLYTDGGLPYIAMLPTGSAPIEAQLGYPPNSDTIHVIGQTQSGVQSSGGLTINEQMQSQANFPSIQSVQEFRVSVANTAGLNEVYINAATYTKPFDGSRQQWSGGVSSGLAAAIAALVGTGKQRVAWITFDNETNTVHVETPIAAATPIGPLPSRAEYSDTVILAMTTSYSKDIPIYLYDGQTLAEIDIYRRLDSRLPWFGGDGGGGSSPLTTKGDLYGYDTADARIPVGADGQVLTADSTQALGVKWGSGGGSTIAVTTDTLYAEALLYDNTLGSAGTWDVSSIDQTYDDLEIVLESQASVSTSAVGVNGTFNGDTTDANYREVETGGNGSSNFNFASSSRQISSTGGAGGTSNRFNVSTIFIANYAGTSHQKVSTSIVAIQYDGSTQAISNQSRVWDNTSAINRIAIEVGNATNTFAAGSRLRIIGRKNKTVVTNVTGAGTVQFTGGASATVTNTTSETTLVSTPTGTKTLAANALSSVGRQIRIEAWGYVGDILTPTLDLRFKLGSTAILDTGAVTLVTLTGNKLWHFVGTATVQVLGASGKIIGQGQFTYNQLTTDILNTSQISIDTTTSLVADLTAQFGTASSSNTIVCTNILVEILN